MTVYLEFYIMFLKALEASRLRIEVWSFGAQKCNFEGPNFKWCQLYFFYSCSILSVS